MQNAHHADNTKYVYSSGVLAYLRFCIFFGLAHLPVEDATLARFVAFQSCSCGYGSLKVYLYGIRDWSMKQGHPFVAWSLRYQVFSAMMGIKRLFGAEQAKKLAVSPELLLAMVGLLHLTEINDIVMRAAMLVAFFGMFRKDNISVAKAAAFNPRANLTRGDVFVRGSTVWVRVGHSKVNQFGVRFHWVPLIAIPGSPLCPVTAVKAVLALCPGAPSDSPMFTWRTGTSTKPMTHSNFVGAFKKLVKAAGLEWKQYSGHSFRRGGATFAFNLGVNPELIQYLGDWASDAYKRYQEMSLKMRLSLPQVMAAAVTNGLA